MTLQSLISAVKRGEWPGGINGIARAVFPYHEDWRKDHGMTAREAYNGSLDAAKRLHDALLPGWRVGQLGQAHAAPDDTPDRWRAWIVAHDYLESTIQSEAESTDPARAWLLAILRALEGEP